MGVKRTALAFEGQFTQIPNEWVRDQRLSRKARGVLAEIMSHSVGWHVSVNGLVKSGPEGRDAIKAALAELKDADYLQVSQTRGKGGRWNEVEYELCDPATADGLSVTGGLAANGLTASGQSAPKNTISIEDHQLEVLSGLLDELWKMWPAARRSTRKVVEKSLRTALKSVDAQTLRTAVEQHSRVWSSWPSSDVQYVPLLSTWLNQERWAAAPPLPRAGGQSFARQAQSNSLALFEHYKNQEVGHAEIGGREVVDVQALN